MSCIKCQHEESDHDWLLHAEGNTEYRGCRVCPDAIACHAYQTVLRFCEVCDNETMWDGDEELPDVQWCDYCGQWRRAMRHCQCGLRMSVIRRLTTGDAAVSCPLRVDHLGHDEYVVPKREW